jgi:tellurite resistance protein TerC
MAKVLELVDRHNGYNALKDGLRFTFDSFMAKDNHYTLFRWEDRHAWVIFSTVFLALILFDNVILHRNPKALTITRAILYTVFYMFAAVCFCGWVCWWKSPDAGYMWMSGYMLEWMLSFDNLFVFHLIFNVYCTPDYLKHRPLYLGIMGAVVFRLVFIFIGEWLMHALFFMHFVFGAFLIYTGIKTVTADEEDEDPSEQQFIKWLQATIPFVPVYDHAGRFFVHVPVNENGEADIPKESYIKEEVSENTPILAEESDRSVDVVDFDVAARGAQKTQLRATMLFVVVCCLEFSDILFAVDSVSAIVAQVNDLFLAYTSAVFAMLGLRATFFIIDVLVQLFELLKYGVAIVLVFVGAKLIVGRFYHVPASVVCVVLVGAIAGSMVASVLQNMLQKKEEGVMSPEIAERVAKIKNSPFATPTLSMKGSPKAKISHP